MEQGQDLGRAAADIFMRLRGGLAVWSPTAARVRHSLERAGLILAPYRQAKASALGVIPSAPNIDVLVALFRDDEVVNLRVSVSRALGISPLDQPLFTAASGSVMLTKPPCLRLRITTPVSHQVRLFCQPKPAACRIRPIV